LVSSVIFSLLNGERARCTHGGQLRDFMHVEDVACAFVALLEGDIEGIVNIGSGKRVSIRSLVSTIAQSLDQPGRIDFCAIDAPPNDPPLLVPDVRRLCDEVGWAPRFSLNDGIANTIAWWRARINGAGTRA
jgi:nucleoside-diphosphate-sugar epimerase